MTTRVDLEYLSPMTYELLEWELPAPELNTSPDPDAQQNDLAYFMNLAGRHKLLSAAQERTLGTTLWIARRRLLRILRRARYIAPGSRVICCCKMAINVGLRVTSNNFPSAQIAVPTLE